MKALSSSSDDTSLACVFDKTLVFVVFWSFYQKRKRGLEIDAKQNLNNVTDQCFGLRKSWFYNENFKENKEEKKKETKCLYIQIYYAKVAADSTVRKIIGSFFLIRDFTLWIKKSLNQADIFFSLIQNILLMKTIVIHNQKLPAEIRQL